jgi:hypothetical protein
MKANNLCLRDSFLSAVIIAGSLCLASAALCQQKQAPASEADSCDKFPAAKAPGGAQRTMPARTSVTARKTNTTKREKDGPDAIRKREEWFYKQRVSVNGRTPSGARLEAQAGTYRLQLPVGKT